MVHFSRHAFGRILPNKQFIHVKFNEQGAVQCMRSTWCKSISLRNITTEFGIIATNLGL